MGIRHLATLLPMVAPLARSGGHPALKRTRRLRNLQSAYSPEECDRWISKLVENDENGSGGLSGSEYLAFLSGIDDPPYIAAYFEAYDGFDQMPWVFRVIHKSLACHCQKLGLGEECCKGNNAEVPLQGLQDNSNGGEAEIYKDVFCQQVSYVFKNSIPSPAPTDGPSVSPTKSPTSSPTPSPSTGPSAAPVTGSPTRAPSAGPTESPTRAPSTGPTAAAAPEPTDAPSAPPVAVITVKSAVEEEEEDEPGNGLIVGIVVACVAALVAAVAFVAHRRRAEEREELRKFAGDQAPDADLEAAPTAPEDDEPAQAPAPKAAPDADPPGQEPDEDDESSAPSVWSASEEESTLDELHEDHEDPGATAGSALAAMGAASTVAARIGANGNSQ